MIFLIVMGGLAFVAVVARWIYVEICLGKTEKGKEELRIRIELLENQVDELQKALEIERIWKKIETPERGEEPEPELIEVEVEAETPVVDPGPSEIIIDRSATTPNFILDAIKKRTSVMPVYENKPMRSEFEWGMFASTTGGIKRRLNEDYFMSFEIGDFKVLIIADGVGGHKYGRKASRIVTVLTGITIIRNLRSNTDERVPDFKRIFKEAFRNAKRALEEEYERLKGNLTERQALCTTLIVVISDGQNYHYMYIGDGGGYILRPSTAELFQFLLPQNMEGEGDPDTLQRWLGPLNDFEPSIGSLPMRDGDVLMTGTDGVFKCFPPGFPVKLLKKLMRVRGDVRRVVEEVLSGVFLLSDDNGTFGIHVNGKPEMCEGFWKKKPESFVPVQCRGGSYAESDDGLGG